MKIRKLMRRGKPEWVLDFRLNGTRVRKWHKSKALAETALEEIRQQLNATGKVWASLTDEERAEALQVFAEVKQARLSLREVWHSYRTSIGKPAPKRRTLTCQFAGKTSQGFAGENQPLLR